MTKVPRNGSTKPPLWHTLDHSQALSVLESRPEGLTTAEVNRRLAKWGGNILPQSEQPTVLALLVRQFSNPFVATLLSIALVVAWLEKLVDAATILVIVGLNALLGLYHERRAAEALSKIKDVLSPHARVRRGGKIHEVDVTKIVPGDILILAQGDRLPADARVIEAKNLSVNESLLTGEALPERKEEKPLPRNHLPLADRKNMLYAGSTVEAGTAEAIIVATGQETELGQIAAAVKEAPEPPSLFEQRLRSLGRYLMFSIIIVALGFFVLGLLKNQSPLTMFLAASAMAVSLIPEGLPMIVTLSLAIGVTRMARRRAIMRRLAAVETLGAVTVICTDKTGTLTENAMTVKDIVTPHGRYNLSGQGFDPAGSIFTDGQRADPGKHVDLADILQAGVLANEAQLNPIIGDHTEVALLIAGLKGGQVKEKLLSTRPRLDVLPFDTSLGLMATLHGGGKLHHVLVKGAPETVLERCRLSDKEREHFLKLNEEFASAARRVLAVAEKHVGRDTTLSADEINDLTFLGLVAMEDPPRPEAAAAVRTAKSAGVRVIMLTGDNLHTARAIAHRVGIAAASDESIDGEALSEVDDVELKVLVGKMSVFARVSPLQKLRIVKALKARGELVAVTGDGINDAPALSQADIGIAMGQSGTDVAREAAKMILEDDNFASIVAAIEEGRTVYNNVQRVILYLLSTSLGEAVTIVVGFMIGLPLPLLPLQILWINLVTDGIASLPLAFEPSKERVMSRPPRDPHEHIFNREMIIRTILVGLVMAGVGLWLFATFLPEGEERARTIMFVFLVVAQLFNVLNVRSKFDSVLTMSPLSNRVLLPALVVAFSFTLGVIYLPSLQRVFEFSTLSFPELMIASMAALAVILAMEVRKFIWNLGSRWRHQEISPRPSAGSSL